MSRTTSYTSPRRDRRGTRGRHRGFTLIEAALTTVIIGVGFTGMLELLAAGTSANVQSCQKTTAVNLARNIREMSLKVPYAQLPALNGQSHSPPVDSCGTVLAGFDGWTQSIQVKSVNPASVTTDIDDPEPLAVRVTVTVAHNGEEACKVSWYALDGLD